MSAESSTTKSKSGSKKSDNRGRPKGARNKALSNGVITTDDIFLYTPEETIPKKYVDRFLKLCDNMIITLDANTVTEPEVEEIAQYYRDRLFLDELYSSINDLEVGVAADTTLIRSLDSLSKQLEKRKENLQLRSKDRADQRKLTKQKTLMDLLGELDENKMAQVLAEQEKVTSAYVTGGFTNPMEYMEERAPKGYEPVEDEDD
jgi:hypothetical protein